MEIQGIKITKWHYISLVLLAILIFLIYVTPSNETDIKDEDRDLSVMAFVVCKNLVEKKLVSPATADFPFLDRQTWTKGHQSYKIRSYVDSQNANGAIIRTNWNCYVEYKGSGDVYNPINWKSELEFF